MCWVGPHMDLSLGISKLNSLFYCLLANDQCNLDAGHPVLCFLLLMQNLRMVWVGMHHKAHPVIPPAMVRDTFH